MNVNQIIILLEYKKHVGINLLTESPSIRCAIL